MVAAWQGSFSGGMYHRNCLREVSWKADAGGRAGGGTMVAAPAMRSWWTAGRAASYWQLAGQARFCWVCRPCFFGLRDARQRTVHWGG